MHFLFFCYSHRRTKRVASDNVLLAFCHLPLFADDSVSANALALKSSIILIELAHSPNWNKELRLVKLFFLFIRMLFSLPRIAFQESRHSTTLRIHNYNVVCRASNIFYFDFHSVNQVECVFFSFFFLVSFLLFTFWSLNGLTIFFSSSSSLIFYFLSDRI